MKRLSYTLLITFLAISAWGQSEQLFTHYMFNQMNFNPAVAGSQEVLDLGGIYRQQWWSGIDGSPRSINIYGHTPFAKRKHGLGLNMISDKIGLYRILSLGIDYAFRIKFKKSKNVLALGLGARYENARADWGQANDGVNKADGEIGADTDSKSTFNIGPGIYFHSYMRDGNFPKWYLGLSVPRLLANSLYGDKDQFGSDVNTYYFQGGLTLRLASKLKLLPNTQIRFNPNAPFDFDIGANFMFFDALWLGATYRYEDSIDGLIGYQFKNGLRLGFAMDFTTSELKNVTTGSYEIMVGYTFPCDDCFIRNLRFFGNTPEDNR
jgi:type IX secretion system PorP/SprF family membrane protein